MKHLLNALFNGKDSSPGTVDLRAKFDSIISNWQSESPRLAPLISDEKLTKFGRAFLAIEHRLRQKELGITTTPNKDGHMTCTSARTSLLLHLLPHVLWLVMR